MYFWGPLTDGIPRRGVFASDCARCVWRRGWKVSHAGILYLHSFVSLSLLSSPTLCSLAAVFDSARGEEHGEVTGQISTAPCLFRQAESVRQWAVVDCLVALNSFQRNTELELTNPSPSVQTPHVGVFRATSAAICGP